MLYKLGITIFVIYFLSTALALKKNNQIKKDDNEGIPWVQCFNPLVHFSVAIGMTLALIPLHIWEQIFIRIYGDECRDCFISRTCQHGGQCGCDTRAKALSPFESCSKSKDKNFGPIVWSRKKYEKIREDSPVKLLVQWMQKTIS